MCMCHFMHVLYETRRQIHCTFDKDHMNFASTLIWYHSQTNTYTTHTGDNKLTQKYILTPSILLTAAICVTLSESLISKIHFTEVHSFFASQKLLKVIYLLIRFNKTKSFLWNTKNIDKNHVNKQKAHTPDWEIDDIEKG